MPQQLVGIIGGSGLGDSLIEHLTDTQEFVPETPFGHPSGPIVVEIGRAHV